MLRASEKMYLSFPIIGSRPNHPELGPVIAGISLLEVTAPQVRRLVAAGAQTINAEQAQIGVAGALVDAAYQMTSFVVARADEVERLGRLAADAHRLSATPADIAEDLAILDGYRAHANDTCRVLDTSPADGSMRAADVAAQISVTPLTSEMRRVVTDGLSLVHVERDRLEKLRELALRHRHTIEEAIIELRDHAPARLAKAKISQRLQRDVPLTISQLEGVETALAGALGNLRKEISTLKDATK